MTTAWSKVHRLGRWRRAALASTALPLLLMAAPAAFAQPAANSLPGNFRVVNGAATYGLNTGSTNAATIAVSTGGTPTALSWGGTAGIPVTMSPSTGATQNAGFSVGSGATLTVQGVGTAAPLLLNDATGSPSEIFGSVNFTNTLGTLPYGAPVYVANANGVVVGATGTISTGAGLGLIGYAQDPTTFTGTGGGKISVTSTTAGTGDVSVVQGASFSVGSGRQLLVAGNGAVNIGAAPVGGVMAVAGYAFTSAGTTGVLPVVSLATPLPASTASVALSDGSTASPLLVNVLDVAGNVTNAGVTTFTPAGAGVIGGTFTNGGVANTSNILAGSIVNTGTINDNAGSGSTSPGTLTASGDITNSGTINEGAYGLTVQAGWSTGTGNFNNTGTIDFTSVPVLVGGSARVNRLAVTASNIYLGGTIEQATSSTATNAPLSSTNVLGAYISPVSGAPLSGPGNGLALTANGTAGYGVIDVATTAYVADARYYGMGLRFMSGAVVDPIGGDSSVMWIQPGAATDPFAGNASLNYNLSLFPGTTVSAPRMYLYNQANNTVGTPNVNLDGVLGGANTTLVQFGINTSDGFGTINGDAGLGLADGGVFRAYYTGNINNPNGAELAGQTAYQYNFLPITVAGGGTATLDIANGRGPSSTSGTEQLVNVLVNGNAMLHTTGLPAGLPTTSTAIVPNSTYTNNHLVVQATGNITVGDSNGSVYWPGLVILNNAASASDPTAISASGSTTLGGASYVTDLNNILPAISNGGTGIFFLTNTLKLNGGGGIGTVSTSNNSWVNFANATIASSFASTSGAQFFGAYTISTSPTSTELGLQQLPASDFQPQ